MNVLIIGKNSFVGENIKHWLEKKGDYVETVDSISDDWKLIDYSNFDSVIQVAAIVHKKNGVPWSTYLEVNTLLPIEAAKLAKEAGVDQFVFISTMGVFGMGKTLPKNAVIQKDTQPDPVSDYGKSKYRAEQLLIKMKSDNFNVAIVRPPNLYGKNAPGNYISTFVKITDKLPIFPKAFVPVKQSFLYIDNLSEIMYLIIHNQTGGIFHPQDASQVGTVELLTLISDILGNRLTFSYILGYMVTPLQSLPIINKLYGGVIYEQDTIPDFDGAYRTVDIEEGMRRTLL